MFFFVIIITTYIYICLRNYYVMTKTKSVYEKIQNEINNAMVSGLVLIALAMPVSASEIDTASLLQKVDSLSSSVTYSSNMLNKHFKPVKATKEDMHDLNARIYRLKIKQQFSDIAETTNDWRTLVRGLNDKLNQNDVIRYNDEVKGVSSYMSNVQKQVTKLRSMISEADDKKYLNAKFKDRINNKLINFLNAYRTLTAQMESRIKHNSIEDTINASGTPSELGLSYRSDLCGKYRVGKDNFFE